MTPSWVLDRRLLILKMGLIMAIVSLLGVFWYVQVLTQERYAILSQKNRIRRVWIPPVRGKILDRNGVVMVDNRTSFDISLEFEAIKERKTAIDFLTNIFKVDASEIEGAVKNYKGPAFLSIPIRKDVDMSTLTLIEESRLQIPSITVEVNPVRKYVLGQKASALLGYVGSIDKDEYQTLKDRGYHWLDSIGKSGVESACEAYLRGEPGGMQIEVDHRGHREQILNIKKPIPGRNVFLTIDMKIQDSLEEILEGKIGCGVAMNPNTGEILGVVSKPGFDLNVFIKPGLRSEIPKLFKDPHRPLINRAFQGVYGPGSIFKLVVAAAGLDHHLLDEASSVDCAGSFQVGGKFFRCWKEGGHGTVSLLEAIKYSCNVFFYAFGQRLGPDRIIQCSLALGLGKKTGLDIGGEKEGLVPSPEWKRSRFKDAWYGGDTANLSIGQGYISVTALQVAAMISAIANGGKLMAPHVVKMVTLPEGGTLIEVEPKIRGTLNLLPKTLSILQKGMWLVVNETRGTGRQAYLESLEICGKTGTVEVKKGEEITKQGWFVAYAPYQKPEIVLVLLVEGVHSGGRDVAPLAKQFFQRWIEGPTTSLIAKGKSLRDCSHQRTKEVVG